MNKIVEDKFLKRFSINLPDNGKKNNKIIFNPDYYNLKVNKTIENLNNRNKDIIYKFDNIRFFKKTEDLFIKKFLDIREEHITKSFSICISKAFEEVSNVKNVIKDKSIKRTQYLKLKNIYQTQSFN